MAVSRSRWSDERLDDLAERVMKHDVLEVRMDGLERSVSDFREEMREFRGEMRDFRKQVSEEMREFRSETSGDVNSLRSELYATKRWMMTMWLSGVLAFAAIFVEISLRT